MSILFYKLFVNLIEHNVGHMETLVINIPDKKSKLVKQILKGLGVTIQEKHFVNTNYKDKIQQVSIWGDNDMKSFEDVKKSFESLNPAQW